MPTPLDGIRVLDLSHVMAGPVCSMFLADLGAHVTKIEKLQGGDDSRRMVPPTIGGESAAFLQVNRNKHGLALDLKSPEGRKIIERLIERSDVLVENLRPGALARLGFDDARLEEINPRLVHCSITGFGQTGPYAARGGFDLIAQAMSGLMSITGEGAGRPPVKVGSPVTDITSGLLAAIGVLAALMRRQSTGKGGKVDTSLFEAGIMLTYWQSAMALATGVSPGPLGSAHPLGAPYQAFEAADSWLVIGASNQTNWLRLLEVLDRRDLAEDPRFSSNANRLAHLPELEAILTEIFRTRTVADWLADLEKAGVPAGPINSINAMLRDEQTIARNMIVETQHSSLGPIRTLGFPIKLSDMPPMPDKAAPVLGEDTARILSEAGFAKDEVAAFAAAGAINL